MPEFFIYLLKIILCSGILYGYYWLALRNKVFHHYNRFYLLASVVVSLILPFVQINIRHNTTAVETGTVQLLKVVSGGNDYLDEMIVKNNAPQFTLMEIAQLTYWVVSTILLFIFLRGLVKIYTLYKKHRHSIVENIYLIHCNETGTPFSFLRYIFWNIHIDINSSTGRQIFKHELSHVQEKHTHDKLFINIILALLWCNPFYWLIRKELNMIHEFIADKTAVEDSDTADFAYMILQAAYPQQQFYLTNPFFYSPIKRRLSMLTKNNNSKAGYIGRLLVLPLLLFVFAAFGLKTTTGQTDAALFVEKPITVVIDAGHGGKDFGAESIEGKLYEKDITLAIIKKIKALNTNKNVHIILTRENDIYQSPPEKADLVNKLQADLMISIHTDAANKDSAATKSGMSFFVARDNYENAEASKMLASVLIATFKNNTGLQVTDNPQQRSRGIWILQESKCPAVLLEAGYISNKRDLDYLSDETNQEEIARNILTGIERYAVNVQKLIGKVSSDKTDGSILKTTAAEESISFSVKNVSISDNNTNAPTPVSSMNGNIKIDKKDTEKMLLIVNGERMPSGSLHNVTIKAGTASIYSAGNEAMIKEYGPGASNGVFILNNARIIQNKTANNTGTMIEVDSATVLGATTIQQQEKMQKNDPLYVVNGIIKTKAYVATIAPEDIEKIDVLKNKMAFDKYGESGKNGVVEITLKKVLPYKEMIEQQQLKKKTKPAFPLLTKA